MPSARRAPGATTSSTYRAGRPVIHAVRHVAAMPAPTPPIEASPLDQRPPGPPCSARKSPCAPTSAATATSAVVASPDASVGVRRATRSAPAATPSTIASAWSETITWLVPTTTRNVGSTTASSKPRADASSWGRRGWRCSCNATLRGPGGWRGLTIAEVGHGRAAGEARREAHLHARVVLVEGPRLDGELEQEAVRVLQVDRLHPLVIDDGCHPCPLRDQLRPLGLERLHRPDREGEVVEGLGHPEPPVDARIVLGGDARHATRLHEGHQLSLA